MLSWAILLLCIFVNTVLFRKLPLIEGIVTFIHVLGFFAFIIVLWCVLTSRFGRRQSNSLRVGPWLPRHCFIRLHRVRDEWLGHHRLSLPCRFEWASAIPERGRLSRASVRGVEKRCLGTPSFHGGHCNLKLHHLLHRGWYVILVLISHSTPALSQYQPVTLMFCLGDLESVLDSPTGQPYIAVVLNATHSVAAAKVLVVVILILVVSCSVNGVTTTSRQLW